MAERDSDDRLLARWSRRKAAARRGELAAEPGERPVPVPDDASNEAAPAPAGAAGEPEPPALELPDPETLDAASDFSGFMRPGVPAELKRRALRRLWRVNPIYSHHDGLDDYCGDYTDQARVVGRVRTAYRVGRGLLDQVAKVPETAPPVSSAGAATPDRAIPSGDAAPEPAAIEGGNEPPPGDHEIVCEPATRVALTSAPAAPVPEPDPTATRRPRPLPRRG